MSRTMRWWQRRKSHCKLIGTWWWDVWDNINPYYFKHESKKHRVIQSRNNRHENRIRIQKGKDVEKKQKTEGWETH